MIKRNVIHGANKLIGLPVVPTAVAWLLLDRLRPNERVVGVIWTLFVIYWIFAIVDFFITVPRRVKFED